MNTKVQGDFLLVFPMETRYDTYNTLGNGAMRGCRSYCCGCL